MFKRLFLDFFMAVIAKFQNPIIEGFKSHLYQTDSLEQSTIAAEAVQSSAATVLHVDPQHLVVFFVASNAFFFMFGPSIHRMMGNSILRTARVTFLVGLSASILSPCLNAKRASSAMQRHFHPRPRVKKPQPRRLISNTALG